jgi:RNA polymerase sigma-70 factor (ECF subfamily)
MDDKEFIKGVRDCEKALYTFLIRLLRDKEEAKEVMQTAILKAWKGRNGFKGASQFKTWLFKIAMNVAMDRIREREKLLELKEYPFFDSVSDPIIKREENEKLQEALEKLPSRQRTALLLKIYGELTYSEIAKAMNLTEGAIKVHIHQAIKKLKESFNKDEMR